MTVQSGPTLKKAGGQKTRQNLKKVIDELEMSSGKRLTEAQIWMGIKRIPHPRVSDFLWRMMHGRIKCGSWFRFIPNWSEKQFCPCGEIEEIDHILLECRESEAEGLWSLMKGMWERLTKTPFVRPTMAMIMGIGSVTIKDGQGKEQAMTKIYRTFITIAAWVIWRNRNERVFNDVEPTQAMQKTKWIKEVRESIRIEFDEISLFPIRTRGPKYKKFEQTWALNGVLCEVSEGVNVRTLTLKKWEEVEVEMEE